MTDSYLFSITRRIYYSLIYHDVEIIGPVLQLFGESFCRGVPEPGREGVLCKLSGQFIRNVVLVGNVPTEVCQVMLCELHLLACPLNLDGKGGYNYTMHDQGHDALVHLEQFFISEVEGHKGLADI